MKTKTISILGSTGSIGRQTLDVVDGLGIQVAALAAHSGVSRLEEQCRRFRPKLAVLADETAATDLKVRLAGTETKVLGGADALCEAAWGDNPYGYENSLMAHIRRIREKIEESPSKPESLITVKGLGYKLMIQ